MKKYNKITPQGTRDRLFEECAARGEISRKLSRLFESRGYSEIITPALEYYDVFSGSDSGFSQEEMYKLTDAAGRLLVLRPDITLPIARVAATRLKDAPPPLRLCYTAPVYRVNAGFTGRSNEILQSGMELLGASGIRADLEIITAGIEALSECGAPDFRVEIGHGGFISGLLGGLSLEPQAAQELRGCVECKDYVALGRILEKAPPSPARELLLSLPKLSGGAQVLEYAKSLCGDKACKGALSYLEKIYADLGRLGHGDKITIDLSLTHSNRYYTGVIFRGYIQGSGVTVLSGGRYDGLLEEFGAPMPATGFAVENDALSEALAAGGQAPKMSRPAALVFGRDAYEMEAQLHMDSLIASGLVCELSLDDTEEQARRRAEKRGIPRLDIVGETTETVYLKENVSQ